MNQKTENRRRTIVLAVLGVVVLLCGVALWGWTQLPHHTPGTPADVEATGDVYRDAIRKGLAFLQVHQETDGFFVAGRLTPKPAYTALVVDAFLNSPERYSPAEHPFLQKGLSAIVSTRKEDGGLYTGVPGMTFANYSTALSVVTLKQIEGEQYADVIRDAVNFLKRGQFVGEGEDAQIGGFGYSGPDNPDMNNTVIAIEALKAAGVPEDDPVYENVRKFITKSQNRSESNPLPWAGNDGGFIYKPGDSPAGAEELPGGGRGYKSYGTMTSAGVVGFLYANVEKTDPRVQAGIQWISRHYDLKANVNLGDKGLYYYYRMMAKALSAYGETHITTPDGEKHEWARDLADTLLRMQQPDGSWINANPSYLEGDPILVTAYAVRTLSICYDEMQKGE